MSEHNDRRGQEYEEGTIAHACRRHRKAKDKTTRTPPNYADEAVHGYTYDQQMPPSLQGLLTLIGHMVPTVMMVVHTIMDIRLHQSHIGVHCLTHLNRLALLVNHILVNPIRVAKIKIIFRFSTNRLLIMETIIIIVSQFMVVIQVQVVNLRWTQLHHTSSTNKGHIHAANQSEDNKYEEPACCSFWWRISLS